MSGTGAARLTVNGVELVADPAGAAVWPERRSLIVADLHLEKGSAFAARGRPLPPYDTASTLERLAACLARHRPEHVICLGDSFHDNDAAGRLAPADTARLRQMTAAHEWIWITGNHDPTPPAGRGGRSEAEVTLGALVLRHAARPGAAGEVSGHYHPKAAVRVRGRRLAGRCFVGDGRRLVLPAFGAYAGGLSVLDPAIAGLFADGFRVHILGRRGVFGYPRAALSA